MFGTTELLIVLGIVVLLFGASRLPQIGGGLGKAISNFRRGGKNPDEITDDAGKKDDPAAKTEKTAAKKDGPA
ncbi:MAG: twin-arginine translocase TatA/TatE family subunit [Proteobacteria bacterium]|nr:twin-arginine translocase TatA/TatE family subunit [Pseudomonadota bacterium]